MKVKFIILMLWFVVCQLSHSVQAQNKTIGKKLIEFGWDYPDIKYLKDHINQMEKQPFDGVVFSIAPGILNAFDTLQLPDSYFQYESLSAIPWKKFTDNFLVIWGSGISGGHWLDDNSWTLITNNLVKVSKALSAGRLKGIAFDAEYYFSDPDLNPWVYKPSLYKNLSYQQVGFYTKERGRQFIYALQKYKPDISILSFWLLSLANQQKKHKPLPEIQMALLPFFVEGVLEGLGESAHLIDGNEQGYWFQQAQQFILAGEDLRSVANELLTPKGRKKYKTRVTLAQPVFLDGLYGKTAEFDQGFDTLTKQNWLRENLLHAFKTTDKYVWFYNERTDWWRNKYDTSVLAILKQVRDAVKNSSVGNIVTGQSQIFNFKTTKADPQQGFKFKYFKTSNLLEITPQEDDIKTIRLFENSKLIYNIDRPVGRVSIRLNKKYLKEGVLTILAEHINGKFSTCYVN